jgi:hypothetical protein
MKTTDWYTVTGSHAINVAAGRFEHGERATLTPAEAQFLQRAGAVSPIEEVPTSVGRPRSRAEAGLPTTSLPEAEE